VESRSSLRVSTFPIRWFGRYLATEKDAGRYYESIVADRKESTPAYRAALKILGIFLGI